MREVLEGCVTVSTPTPAADIGQLPCPALLLPVNEAMQPRGRPGTVRVTIRQPDDGVAAMATMKHFVQGFAWIAVKSLRDGTPLPDPIDIEGAA